MTSKNWGEKQIYDFFLIFFSPRLQYDFISKWEDASKVVISAPVSRTKLDGADLV